MIQLQSVKKALQAFSALALMTSLMACNGSSGSNGENPFGNTLTVGIYDSSCQNLLSSPLSAGQDVCVKARLLNENQPDSGKTVSFSATLGTLAAASGTTDSSGEFSSSLTLSSANIGSGDISASSSGLTASANYDVVSSGGAGGSANVTIAVISDGLANNKFKAGNTVTLRATVNDSNGNPLNNQIVNFTAEVGTLTPSSTLSTGGIAEVQLNTTDTDLGAAVATVSFERNGQTLTSAINYEVLSPDALNETVIQFGSFNNGTFEANVLGTTTAKTGGEITISAGSTVGISAAIVDQNGVRITTPTQVTFTSNCVQNQRATIESQVLTINGEALATYKDNSCAGSTGNTDQIVATVVANNTTLTLTQTVNIQAETVGSIQFISASPESIVLKGTGGQGNSSISTLVFQVNGAQGNPLAQQRVDFALNTEIGGLSVSPAFGFTNSEGQVATQVNAGNVPTSVRVSATTKDSNGDDISTQSDLLRVNTGLPDQNSISIAASVLNPEAYNRNGETSDITVWLSDSFNNPVPDGTAVTIVAEAGQIDGDCITSNGSCTVTWRSTEPKPTNHRVTILAYADGHETFFDSNANNIFDDADGNARVDGTSNGLPRSRFYTSGFVDLSDAWVDYDEDGNYDAGEQYFDYSEDGQFTPASTSGKFDGPQCTGSKCGNNGVHVRKSIVIIMSSSGARWDLYSGTTRLRSNYQTASTTSINISRGTSRSFQLRAADTANQILANGTTVSVGFSSTSSFELSGLTSFTVNNSNGSSDPNEDFYNALNFAVSNSADNTSSGTGFIEITITSPSGVVTSSTISVNML